MAMATRELDDGHAALTRQQQSAVNLAAAASALRVRRWPGGTFALYTENDVFLGVVELDGATARRGSSWFKRDLDKFDRFAAQYARQMGLP